MTSPHTGEFNIIDRYFKRYSNLSEQIKIGIGDDAAVIRPLPECDTAICIDTLVEGVHFPRNTLPYDIGWKALAVNLSDLAAMGARPEWFTLALTLPEASDTWLEAFSKGLFDLATRFHLPLIGGDLTKGPLTITVQAAGSLKSESAMKRSDAQCDDHIWVSGTLGDARAGLTLALANSANTGTHCHDFVSVSDSRSPHINTLLERLNRPSPRIDLGMRLHEYAHACIDISDGLLADLGHILDASALGATLNVNALPVSEALASIFPEETPSLALQSGDDYELCFTAPANHDAAILALADQTNTPVTCIGKTTPLRGIRLIDKNGAPFVSDALCPNGGYRHF
jgi:thiamine-monophosphate kinase